MPAKGYAKFKKIVLRRCMHMCEFPGCDSNAPTVHHMFKRSTYPEYITDPDNGVGYCGTCHSFVEEMLRNRVNVVQYYPKDRYESMENKVNAKLRRNDKGQDRA